MWRAHPHRRQPRLPCGPRFPGKHHHESAEYTSWSLLTSALILDTPGPLLPWSSQLGGCKTLCAMAQIFLDTMSSCTHHNLQSCHQPAPHDLQQDEPGTCAGLLLTTAASILQCNATRYPVIAERSLQSCICQGLPNV